MATVFTTRECALKGILVRISTKIAAGVDVAKLEVRIFSLATRTFC